MSNEIPSAFERMLDRDPIYDSLFDHCSPATIYRIGRVNRTARLAVQDYVRRAFDIDRHLRRFFAEPHGFRMLQAKTKCVISGSNALQFMDRSIFADADMDLYVTASGARDVCEWILKHGGMGYEFRPSKEHQQTKLIDDEYKKCERKLRFASQWTATTTADVDRDASSHFYRSARIVTVLTFASTSDKAEGGSSTTVQVIVTEQLPMDCILGFHSTVVMNVITHSAAISLYPKATFEDRVSLICAVRDIPFDEAVAKYARRGWTNLEDINKDTPRSLRYGGRWVGDRTSWIIPLASRSQDGEKESSRPELEFDPHLYNSFDLSVNEGDDLPEMSYAIIYGSRFEHCYTASDAFAGKVTMVLCKFDRFRAQREFLDYMMPSWKKTCLEYCSCNGGWYNCKASSIIMRDLTETLKSERIR